MAKRKYGAAIVAASLILSSCGSSDQKTPDTPTEPAAEVADTEQAPKPKHMPVSLSGDPSITCDAAAETNAKYQAAKKTRTLTLEENAEQRAAVIRSLECLAPQDGKATIVALNEPGSASSFEVSSDPEDYVKACTVIAGAVAEGSGADLASAGAISAYANKVSCPSMVEGALKGDPLVILAPDWVQGRYATKQILMELQVYDEAKDAGRGVEEYAKENAGKYLVLGPAGGAVLAAKDEIADAAKRAAEKGKATLKKGGKEGQRAIDKITGKRKLW
ncbi:hypothetical protein V6U71_04905 [Sphingopyxis sp. J-6]|uniref:hypothetical protein n=1 Tax=Sphingopyxis sp. J-6 TaxID=3122054 RepID=UPI003983EF91